MVSCEEKFSPVPVRVYVTSVENSMGKKCDKSYHRNKKEKPLRRIAYGPRAMLTDAWARGTKSSDLLRGLLVYPEKSSCQTAIEQVQSEKKWLFAKIEVSV